MQYKYINNFTGEVYTSLLKATLAIFSDVINHLTCKTIKMLSVSKIK